MRSLITLIFLLTATLVSLDETQAQSLRSSHLIKKNAQVSTQGSASRGRSLVQEVAQPATTKTKFAAPAKTVAAANPAAGAAKDPWVINSRIHLEKGTNQGYIVVQVDLAEGHHVYSLNPQGSVSPTRLAVLPSNDLRVKSKFVSDKEPIVIEKDPVFEQRIEKHKGQVRFFAPIVVRGGIDHSKLAQEVQFSGQVCSANGCRPIRGLSVTASFGGYFEIPKTSNKQSAGQESLR